ncbi:Frag1/DRAM/Sfk1 family-domain-containing protein [Mycena leptocephala]|nr:Frag1/DRAM/Sfk1 family-domain-containing protein [Mycena leptocephala]
MSLCAFPAAYVARAHTALASAAFLTALSIGLLYHYKKLVKNAVAGYPEEFFPSVSATIGDWYPERNVFQILIAFTSGPRLGLVLFEYLLHSRARDSQFPVVTLISGVLRTIACGGWVYVTSSDDGEVHDFFMISYLILTIPWMSGCIACAPSQTPGNHCMVLISSDRETSFFLSLIPLVYFYIQHKVHRVPGAYTKYSVFEWNLIALDLVFDSIAEDELKTYIFWSIFTSLIPTLFYFSVWELGIAGHELALLSTLSPIFLSVTPVLTWAKSRDGSTTLHILSLLGLAAFSLTSPSSVRRFIPIIPTPLTRTEYSVTGLGLLLSSLSKHANHSNNPVWPFVDSKSGGYNKTGLVLAVLAAYEHHSRKPQTSQTNSAQSKKPIQNPKSTPSGNVASHQRHWLTGAVPLGSLVFILHSILSDSSTLISWSWTGYIDSHPRGPSIDTLAHPLWFAYGSAATAVLYTYRNWLGYIGGLNLAIFTMSVIPIVLKRASAAAGVYFTAMLVYCLFCLLAVATVAYAFVPGGVYLRERTDIVMMLQMACLSLAFNWPRLQVPSIPDRKDIVSPALLAYSRVTLAVFSIASLLVTVYRTPTSFPQPFKPGPRILTAGIWTVHFGMDNEGRDSQRLVRNVVRDLELDVIGLLETDLHRLVFGNRDLTRVLVEEMGYYVDTGPGPASHTWGAVLLSKFPIINSTHHLLPSPNGELAPAIEAVLDVFGTEIGVVVAHNGQEEDPLDRELQSTELARIMAASYPRPVIFLGYVVTKPHAPRPSPYEILVNDGRVFDIDQDDWDRWCEYILFRGFYRTAYARISRGKVTDTELQIGRFVLPAHGTTVVDESEEARYLRSQKEDLPEDHVSVFS